ncbi:uncharacterized protein LOC122509581 [Leptopilina heterotoma]|uniref:uncharacterized protein LOC122509581 n=1 Tax=Leptopilina heterotoma TaxID=63436 RepID=UPI001CAA37C4|nr:uncharacterized protein LOC122509581 [Leptopilina heterotoma]
MDLNFFPNDCNVCKKTTDLKRCSRCHMISYCGTEHQKNNWHIHKKICRIISEITREKGLTHLYENMRNCSPSIWTQARKAMIEQISSLMGRELKYFELEMLRYPRACYICYDTRQENLINCPKCPLVSFCHEHSNSTIHDVICADIKSCHTLENKKQDEATKMMRSCTFNFPSIFKTLPLSTEEYLDKSLECQKKLNPLLKIQASTIVYKPLTIFGILLKLNKISSTNLTIFIHADESVSEMLDFCEILLHLMPNLKNLRVITDGMVQLSISGERNVCKFCKAKGKCYQVMHVCFMNKAIIESVVVAVFMDLKPKEQLTMDDPTYFHLCHFSSENCPVAFTANNEIGMRRLKNCYRKFCPKHTISYEGDNDFCSMYVERFWENWSIKKNSEHLLIATCSTSTENTKSEQISKKSNNPIDRKKSVETFLPGICQVCKSPAMEVCTRCKMIFYCGKKHMKRNQLEHKDICKVILGLLNEKGTPHLFDNVDVSDEKSWFEAKLNFLKIAKSKLNRELWNFEKEIFLFPKTCFVCHDSDLSVLKTCECCVSLCKIHRDDEEHKNLCKDFLFNLKWGRSKDDFQKMADITAFASKKDYKQQLSMEKFIDSFFHFKNLQQENPTELNARKIIISDFLSRPQTFLYAVEKLKIPITSSLQVHIIGAINEEIEHFAYWHSVTFWYKNLTDLCLCFVGPGTIDLEHFESKSRFNFLDNTPAKTKICGTMLVDKRYDDFYNSKDFIKPDIIIGYNLDLNESNLGMTDCTWKETFSIISEINVPFLMTAKTEERGRKDHEMICSFLGKTIDYHLFEKNPYASLMPERNYENERLCYSNSYLIAYMQFPRDSDAMKVNSSKKNENNAQKVENQIFAVKPNGVSVGIVKNPTNSEFDEIVELKKFAKEQFSKVKVQKSLLEETEEEQMERK